MSQCSAFLTTKYLLACTLLLGGGGNLFGVEQIYPQVTPSSAESPGDPQISFDMKDLGNSGFAANQKAAGEKRASQLEMVWVAPLGCYVGKYEVTQGVYSALTGKNPSEFKGELLPVDSVNQKDAREFCAELTTKARAAGALPLDWEFTLPNENQWEALTGDASLEDAITSQNGRRTKPENVGTKGPNQYGLYDTLGNVWEWCLVTQVTKSPKNQVLRGASWYSSEPSRLEKTFRAPTRESHSDFNVGFRCLLQRATVPQEPRPN